MADSKISALPASTTPLAGTEVLPIVQSSATKQVSVANLTAGRAISATQLTLTTGNVIVASGQGIDFSATAGTGTSELFADYEEGTWTPAGNGFGGLTVTFATYTKTGRAVTVTFDVTFPSLSGNTDLAYLQGLPFIPATSWSGAGALGYRGSVSMVALQVDLVNTANGSINIYKTGTVNAQNTDVSLSRIVGTVTYFV